MTTKPVTDRLKHTLGNGNTLRTVGLIGALFAAGVAGGFIPKINDIYTKAEAEKLEKRVTDVEKAYLSIDAKLNLLLSKDK